MIDFSSCVEANILGLNIDNASRALRIDLQFSSSQRHQIVVDGMDRFIANEFREQNIIDRVNLWDLKSSSIEFTEVLFELFSFNHAEANKEINELIQKEIIAINNGEKVLLEIEPVFGVSVIVLAKSVKLV